MTNKYPTALILFPAIPSGGAPAAFGVIPVFDGKLALLDTLREHHESAKQIAIIGAVPQKIPGDTWYANPRYRSIMSKDQWCDFIEANKETSLFNGVEDFETLVQLSATNIMDPEQEVHTEMDTPAVIDFKYWHSALRTHGYFKEELAKLWEAIESLFVRTENDSIVISLPRTLDVRRVKPVVYEPFDTLIHFKFRSEVKHSGDEVLETETLSIPRFIGMFGDAVRSIR